MLFIFELTTDAPATQGAQSKISYKISIKREQKRQTIGRNKRTKLTSNTKNSTTKVSLSQGILNNSLSSLL